MATASDDCNIRLWRLDCGPILPQRKGRADPHCKAMIPAAPTGEIPIEIPGNAASAPVPFAPTGTPLTPAPAEDTVAPVGVVLSSGSFPRDEVALCPIEGAGPPMSSGPSTMFASRFIRSLGPPPSSGRLQAAAGAPPDPGPPETEDHPSGVTPLPFGFGLVAVTPSPPLAPAAASEPNPGMGPEASLGAIVSPGPGSQVNPSRKISLEVPLQGPEGPFDSPQQSPSFAPGLVPSRSLGGGCVPASPGRHLLSPRQQLQTAVSPLMSLLRGHHHPQRLHNIVGSALALPQSGPSGIATAQPTTTQPLPMSSPFLRLASTKLATAEANKLRVSSGGGGDNPPQSSGDELTEDDDDKENIDPALVLSPHIPDDAWSGQPAGGGVLPAVHPGRVVVLPADPHLEGLAQLGSLGRLGGVLEAALAGAGYEGEVPPTAPLAEPENSEILPPSESSEGAEDAPPFGTPQLRDSAIALVTVLNDPLGAQSAGHVLGEYPMDRRTTSKRPRQPSADGGSGTREPKGSHGAALPLTDVAAGVAGWEGGCRKWRVAGTGRIW